MKKIREFEERTAGFGHGWYMRVRELADSEAVPDGAEVVPDDTPVSAWTATTRPEGK